MHKNNNIGKDFSVIILAAGKSERLGFPKLSLEYNEQHTFIEQIAQEYSVFGCKVIIVVVNKVGLEYIKEHHLKFPVNAVLVVNEYPEWHRFYSLKTGVKALKECQSVFIHNVDNPFVNHQILTELLESSDSTDYIIPEYKGKGGHPILISKKIVDHIISIDENQVHLKEFLNQYSKLKTPVQDEKVLVNINTMDEYKKFFSSGFKV